MWYLSKNMGRYVKVHDLPALELLEAYIDCVRLERLLPDRYYRFSEETKEEILKRRGLELPNV